MINKDSLSLSIKLQQLTNLFVPPKTLVRACIDSGNLLLSWPLTVISYDDALFHRKVTKSASLETVLVEGEYRVVKGQEAWLSLDQRSKEVHHSCQLVSD